MVMPSFELARQEPGFRDYIRGFGPRVAQSSRPTEMVFENAHAEVATFVSGQLQQQLNHLPAAVIRLRLEAALRFVALCMSHQAGIEKGFSGRRGKQFIANLLDTMVGMLDASMSDETTELFKQ
jgi:hypothetical protein